MSLPADVAAALREASTKSGSTLAETMLEAVEATGVARITELVEAERRTTARSSGLFPHRAVPKVEQAQTRVTTPLTTTQGNLAVLDQITRQVGAASRSQLISLALRARLQGQVAES